MIRTCADHEDGGSTPVVVLDLSVVETPSRPAKKAVFCVGQGGYVPAATVCRGFAVDWCALRGCFGTVIHHGRSYQHRTDGDWINVDGLIALARHWRVEELVIFFP